MDRCGQVSAYALPRHPSTGSRCSPLRMNGEMVLCFGFGIKAERMNGKKCVRHCKWAAGPQGGLADRRGCHARDPCSVSERLSYVLFQRGCRTFCFRLAGARFVPAWLLPCSVPSISANPTDRLCRTCGAERPASCAGKAEWSYRHGRGGLWQQAKKNPRVLADPGGVVVVEASRAGPARRECDCA